MKIRGAVARGALVAALLAALVGAGCGTPWEPRADAERLLRVLASDAMQGRRAFTPGAEAAADVIAREFEAIGLQPLPGEESFLQRFDVVAYAPDEVRVTVDGVALPVDRVLASLASERIDWQPGDAELVVVGADDPAPFAPLRRLRSGGKDALVLLDPAHAEPFDGLRRFLRRPRRLLPGERAASVVVALAPAPVSGLWSVQASGTVETQATANVVGVLPGRRADELVLVSAHYDHIGVIAPKEGDAIANGANDDASGTVAVIELARYFADRGTPERTLVFAAFTAEEIGGYGARYLASQLDPDTIVAMVNVEMIGKPSRWGPAAVFVTGWKRSDLGEIMARAVEGTDYSFHPDPYPEQNLFFRSDNVTFARLGVPAHSFSTTQIDIDPDYHQVTDEVDTLDLEHLAGTIRALAAGLEPLVSGAATPRRIDPASLQR